MPSSNPRRSLFRKAGAVKSIYMSVSKGSGKRKQAFKSGEPGATHLQSISLKRNIELNFCANAVAAHEPCNLGLGL